MKKLKIAWHLSVAKRILPRYKPTDEPDFGRRGLLALDELDTNGYLLVPGLLDTATVQSLIAEQARFAQPDAPLSVEIQLVHRSAVIRSFAMSGPQVPLAVEVLGPNVCFTHQQFVSKGPSAGDASDVPWHQDSGYGRLEPASDLTVWIALTDTDEENGCLWVIPAPTGKGWWNTVRSAG